MTYNRLAPPPESLLPIIKVPAAIGNFIISFSLVEGVIEVGIAKQLGLDPIRASIVTAGLQFKSRASMLCSLLNLDRKKNADAIKQLKAVMNRGERNDIVHAAVGLSAERDSITFHRRKVAHEYKAYHRQYSSESLFLLAGEFTKAAMDLQKALGISRQEYRDFFHEAHKDASKA